MERSRDVIAAMGKRTGASAPLPDPATFPADKVAEGKNLYVLRCAECHNLGKVIETPAAKQQGPDLINVAQRIDYAWAKDWILDPKTRMIMPGITPDDVEKVRMFLWKTSIEAGR